MLNGEKKEKKTTSGQKRYILMNDDGDGVFFCVRDLVSKEVQEQQKKNKTLQQQPNRSRIK